MTNQPDIAPCPVDTCFSCGALLSCARCAPDRAAIPVERVREVFGSLASQLRSAGEEVRAIDVEDGMRELGIDLREDTSAARAAKGGG